MLKQKIMSTLVFVPEKHKNMLHRSSTRKKKEKQISKKKKFVLVLVYMWLSTGNRK